MITSPDGQDPARAQCASNQLTKDEQVRGSSMMRTATSLLYTIECALLFVTWMTLEGSSQEVPVTATRRFPSGDHAKP